MPTATADLVAEAAPRGGEARPDGQRHCIAELRHRAECSVPAHSTIAFRAAFGTLVVYSIVRFVSRGWVDEFYLSPEHHLTYAGFGWIRPLPAPLMYAHLVALAALGVSIAVGFRPRLAAALFAVGFAYIELIDAALYLNHYWFMTLAAVVLAIVPHPTRSSGRRTVPVITVWALRAQIAVVYVFAGIAKLNPDWLLDAQPMRLWLAARTDRPVIGPLLDEPLVGFAFSWAGAAFDLTIVGWLLWRRSRPAAYAAVVVFHVATALLFQIGVFPWVMIALTPIFFGADWPRRLLGLLRPRRHGRTLSGDTPSDRPTSARSLGRPTLAGLVILAAVNLVLPLRHYAAEGNVRVNDDGYYLSWRVMLTERTGFLEYELVDLDSGESWTVRPTEFLEDWQVAQATTRPDLILATAHLIVDEYALTGRAVGVFANSWVAINGRPRQRWIDPEVDLASIDRDSPASVYVFPESTT